MRVILLERVARLGQMGDVVVVKPGFGRNYLLPQGKALHASPANIASFQARKTQLEARNLETRQEASALAKRLDNRQFVLIRAASEAGALYGSVTSRDVVALAAGAGVSLARQQVVLDKPIKVLGLHPVRVSLHPEVSVSVVLNVARSEVEAKAQDGSASAPPSAQDGTPDAFDIVELDDNGSEGREMAEEIIEDAPPAPRPHKGGGAVSR
ncbi:MAG: 50S ribosomal protein L9 [Rhodobacteraceae bacterium]|nr:50S ribosomal protein L9 [Paracoccaceae bacterium]